MMYLNYTPHDIKVVNIDGNTETFESLGVARVDATFGVSYFDGGFFEYEQNYGKINGLPKSKIGVKYIVSAVVLNAAKKKGRTDCVAPATGHKEVKRNDII